MLNILKNWKNQQTAASNLEHYTKEDILKGEIPEHIAIIMDGNGRWAKKRSLPRIAGHHEGMKVVKRTTKLANELGVKVLTLYAFSTENWKRPKMEVDFLMKLPEEFLNTYLPELVEENVQVRIIGDETALPAHTLRAIEKAVEDTAQNDGMILNFALNYGGRTEIVTAAKALAEKVKEGSLDIEDIDESLFSNYLMTESLQDPELLIRTSGEIRLSNFMLWQVAYSEFVFTDVLWPDFKEDHFLQALGEYQQRGRRFGGI
ncbi:isoprenyl transferase [Bacillus inaquosorum]|uniref:isoprenyl transferase n=1 Tax=Bacillus inaquosorum TaxID=483913 RepID=UPI000A119A7F|nr:isoprenyl transferase [Bacillus inaquosorum]MDZ5720305.1 isoprenyl transferase [Bacillus sp. SXabc123]QJC88668.1 Undecaprenyl diphosphate synthase [Bacillus subtilis]QYX45161.1 isoprenyl transferase [Bacillus inaquosorum]WNW24511.1 isoprenyl transferase [Bacillus inaquosorum]